MKNVRPTGIAECIMEIEKDGTMEAVGNLQLCARQIAGAEAAVHAAKEILLIKNVKLSC